MTREPSSERYPSRREREKQRDMAEVERSRIYAINYLMKSYHEHQMINSRVDVDKGNVGEDMYYQSDSDCD